MKIRAFRWCEGISRLEILLVMAGLVLIVVCRLLPAGSRHEGYRRVQCAVNLQQVAMGFRFWASDHDGQFNFHVSTNRGGSLEYGTGTNMFRHFQVVSNVIDKPIRLICPLDNRQPAKNWPALSNQRLSYFINLESEETKPSKFLCGDRALISALAQTGVSPKDAPNPRLHSRIFNVALSDGSVMQVSTSEWQRLGGMTNRLAAPW